MGKELFEKRKSEFIKVIKREQRLPKPWEFSFSDGEDMRIWFNKITKLKTYTNFLNEINTILNQYNLRTLSDREKEEEFLNCISTINRIPMRNEIYFSDNDDMFTWYMTYKQRNKNFETIVYISLPEYNEFDLATIWSSIKDEFINILKQLKRVPEHGEIILQNDIDVRVVYDKLSSYDPVFFEKLLLHLQTYNKKALSIDERIQQLKNIISKLGYISNLQEARFTDGTDIFTWYMKYKDKLPSLEKELNSLTNKKKPTKKVNIYLIPNFKKRDGKFYTICTNVGEVLDLSQINSFEEAQHLDSNLTERGELLLNEDEEIEYVGFKKGKSK